MTLIGIRERLAYQLARWYQEHPSRFWWWLEKVVSPCGARGDEVDGIMVDVIRERAGISPEDWDTKLEAVRKEAEREKVGLPKKKR